MTKPKIVLAYSGGLDTSIILKWLQLERGFDVVAFTADIGQGDEVEEARVKALATGAVAAYALDLKEEFVRDFVFPMMRSSALYEGYYLLGTSIARPLIAKAMIDIAEKEGAVAISHGATGKGNDQVRFELTAYALRPEIQTVAPWREWEFRGRADLENYAREHGIPVPTTVKDPWSTDANLLHISFEGGILEDPWTEPPAHMFKYSTNPEDAPDQAEYVELEFEGGNPVGINGEKLSPAALLERANTIAGAHGVGRLDLVENRFVGMKSRGVYETPGGTILLEAHRGIEQITMDAGAGHLKDSIMPRYAELIYNGFWFSAEREMLQALIDKSQDHVSGTVR
ncbi:MAG: argininosuccinate synthase, partial [Pseudopedobacter sp.]|nr:argininosuccinate synthase [Deinococcales bacterium]